MAKKGKSTLSPEQRRKRRRNVDALGCYKKHAIEGIPVCRFEISNVPVTLKRRFRAACNIHGDTQQRALMRFLREYSKLIEKKYNVYLDPELPDDYIP